MPLGQGIGHEFVRSNRPGLECLERLSQLADISSNNLGVEAAARRDKLPDIGQE